MNDEIKEILDYLRKYIDNEETGEIIESKHTMNLLLDYITNLQEELELSHQDNLELLDYKSRNEKAIVILNNIYLLDNVSITNNAVEEIDRTINILKGVDKE